MATSRTGTASHKRFRREVLRAGQQAGITNCPLCGVLLDYAQGLTPDGAVADHIVPWSNGGTNHPNNGRVLCRRCNESRGDGKSPRQAKAEARTARHVTTLVEW